MNDAITIQGVRKTFGPKVAVDKLDLVVPRGSITGFLGPNGAGKTTTIRMVMSIIFPDEGDIRVLGKASATESKDKIGYLPEERGLYRKMKVGAFLTYMARLKSVRASDCERRVHNWLKRVDLSDTVNKRCEELSKGMQQKIQFIAAVLHEPELVILDEVFSGLDPLNRRLMRELIDEQHRAGRTIVFSTHAMFEAEALCEHLFMIHQGRKVLDGTLTEIVSRYDPRALVVEAIDANGPGAISRLPMVAAVRSSEEKGLGKGRVIVELKDGASPHEAMAAITACAKVRHLEIQRATLEDVFIEVVRASGGDRVDVNQLRSASGAGASIEGGE